MTEQLAPAHPAPYIIIVIPCYDEAKRLATNKLLEFTAPTYRLEFLFVNDGSKDDTLQVLEKLHAQAPDRLHVLDLPANGGKAEAVRQGFLHAFEEAPDYVGFWDADLATPLDEIPRFAEILEKCPEKGMVFGARVQLMGRTIERKFYRHYFGRVFATVVSVMLQLPIYDTQCGAKLFRLTPALREVFATPFITRWIFDVEVIARFQKIMARQGQAAGRQIYELPLREWHDVRGSKVHMIDGLRAYSDLFKIYRAYLYKQ